VKLEAKPKYVVSSTRKEFPWTNSHHIAGDLRTGMQKLKDAIPAGVLLASGKLATELDGLDPIGSSWSRRSHSAAARSPCTTGARCDSELPHRAHLAGQAK
jgi:hypothetical protein